MTAGIGDLARVAGRYRFTTDPDGPLADWWVYEDLLSPYKRIVAAVGFTRDEMTLEGITREQMRPGCWDPKERLRDMDLNHVEASLCFPTFPRFCGQTFAEARDKEVALACVRAYNDWMVEEWCGDSGGRLIPLCLIPLWDVGLAVKVAARLGIAEGDLCVRTRYEFLSEGRPVQLSTSWEPYDLTSGTLVLLPEAGPHAGLGVVKRMELIGVTISHAVEQPEPRQVTAEEMALLGVPRGTYVTNIQRTYYSAEGRPADIVVPRLSVRDRLRGVDQPVVLSQVSRAGGTA